jgi:hypothetical protein
MPQLSQTRLARTSAFVALLALVGGVLLPVEHVHYARDGHHAAVVHRHFCEASTSTGIHVGGDDDDDGSQAIQAFFTAGEQVGPRQPVLAASYFNDVLPDPSDGRRIEAFRWLPPPHGPPLDPARPLRAPPASS